jgi:ketosteroid isomerase-like protein
MDTATGSSSLSGITEMLELYATSFNNHDPSGVASTLALDDPRFSEFEDVVPGLMRAEAVKGMLRNVARSSGFGMRFDNLDIRELAEGIAMVAGIQKLKTLKAGTEVEFQSRVSLVATRAPDGRWRILHGHFSSVP